MVTVHFRTLLQRYKTMDPPPKIAESHSEILKHLDQNSIWRGEKKSTVRYIGEIFCVSVETTEASKGSPNQLPTVNTDRTTGDLACYKEL